MRTKVVIILLLVMMTIVVFCRTNQTVERVEKVDTSNTVIVDTTRVNDTALYQKSITDRV